MKIGKTISVSSENGKYFREEKRIRAIGKKLSELRRAAFEVSIVSNRKMRSLNREFLGKDRPTNVLCFSAEASFANPALDKNTRYLGEIFLAPDYIRARGENLDRLMIHGFCHLLGYTHDKKRDRMEMEKLEGKLSKTLII